MNDAGAPIPRSYIRAPLWVAAGLLPSPLGPSIPRPRSARTAFTLVEMMVAAGILAIMIVGIGIVFRAAGRAAGTTAADTEILATWGVLDAALRDDLANHLDTPDGLLIIHSELTPATAEARVGATPLGVPRPARADRLAFVARGHYESATAQAMNVTVGAGAGQENFVTSVTTDAALVYYGHGHPADVQGAAGNLIPNPALGADNTGGFTTLPRAEWTLCRRATLLGVPPRVEDKIEYPDVLPYRSNPPTELRAGPEPALPIVDEADSLFNLVNNRIDGVLAGLPGFLYSMVDPDALPPNPTPPLFDATPADNDQGVYYARPLVPRRVTAGTYRRAFPVMLENVGDFIVEWTDGSFVDPQDSDGDGQPDNPRVQWFGMPRDSNGDGTITFPVDGAPFSGDTLPKSVWLGGEDGALATTADNFGGSGSIFAYWGDRAPEPKVTVQPPAASPTVVPIEDWVPADGVYHASWFSNTYPNHYQHRPTAFRIIVRVYDAELRVGAADRDRLPTTDQHDASIGLPAGSDLYGSRYTIVAP